MGIVFRQSVKTSIVQLTGAALGAGYVLATRRILPSQDVGLLNNFVYQYSVLQPFLMFGGYSVVFGYMQRYDEQNGKRSDILSIVFLLPIISAAIFCFFYFLLKAPIIARYQPADQPFLSRYYGWLPLAALVSTYAGLLEAFLASKHKAALAVVSREVIVRCCNLALVGLVYLGMLSFEAFFVGSVLLLLVPLITLTLWCTREADFQFSFRRFLDKKEERSVLHYSWFHLLAAASVTVMGFLDSLVVMPLCASSAMAIYTTAQFIASLLILPYRSMTNAVSADLTNAYYARDTAKLKNIFGRSSVNMLIASGFMFVMIIPNLRNGLQLFPPAYTLAIPLVAILGIGRLVEVCTGVNAQMIAISPRYRFNFRNSVVLIIATLALDRWLIPKGGIVAAAWISTSCIAAFNIVNAVFLYYHDKLNPISLSTLKVLLIIAAVCAAGFFIPSIQQPILDAAIRTPLCLIAYLAMLLSFKASTDLSQYLATVRTSRRLF